MSSAQFPFLSLPIELQTKILEYHFPPTFSIRKTQHIIGAYASAKTGHQKCYAAGDAGHLSILRVSRDVYVEALRVLHRAFTGHLDLSSVQYSSKYSFGNMLITIPEGMPRGLLVSIDLGRIEWREALSLPFSQDMASLKTIKFASSTKGKRSRSFVDAYGVWGEEETAELFNSGESDRFFLDIVNTRARRVWKSDILSPLEQDAPREVRWEVELVGENCPTVKGGYLTTYFTFTSLDDITLTRRAILDSSHFVRSCELCSPDCVTLGPGKGQYCHGCEAMSD